MVLLIRHKLTRQKLERIFAYHRYKNSKKNERRSVKLAKLILFCIAAALVGTLMIWPSINQQKNDFAIDLIKNMPKEAEKLEIINPKIYGADLKNQPYSISCNTAVETGPKSRIVRLDKPKADIELNDDSFIAINANSGLFNQKTYILSLEGVVNIYHDKGYQANATDVKIDLKKGVLFSDSGVSAQGPSGSITAKGFKFYKNEGRYVFYNKPKIIFYPKVTKKSKVTKKRKITEKRK